MLTNGPSDFQRAVIDFFDLGKYFDAIIVSGNDDVGIRKPNPEIFRIMAQKMKLPPESLFMVGDVIEKEILPAIKLGWWGIWITPNIEQVTKSTNLINLQQLLQNFHSIPEQPLTISWLDITSKPNIS